MNWNEANSPVMGESDGNCTLVRNRGVEHEYRCCYSGLSGSPPSCSPVDFVVPGLDGFHFIVWGTEEGLVQVGYYQRYDEEVSRDRRGELGHQYANTPRTLGGKDIRVVLGVPLMESGKEERIRHVEYGGGPHALVVAVTDETVAVVRLDWMLHELILFQDWLGNGVEAVEKYVVCRVNRSSGGNVLGVSWTHQLDGILVSDSSCDIQMWELQSNRSLQLLWSVCAEEPQDIVSAGVRVTAPCATACSHGESNVSVWWYKEGEVRREKLKHSSRLRRVEWSPGVLRKDILDDMHPEHDEVAGRLVPEDHPAMMTLDESGSVRVWVEMLVMHDGSDVSAWDSYFAMTLVVCSPESAPHASSPMRGERAAEFCTWAKPMDSIMGKSTDSGMKSNVLWLVVGWQGDDETAVGLPRLSLYAVRGLAAVVVSNFTGVLSGSHETQGSGSKRRPQVVLWGDHVWNMGTRFRFKDCFGHDSMSAFSARMTFGEDFPKVSCFAAACDAHQFDIAGITMMTSLTEGLPSSPTSVHQSLDVCHTWNGKGYMHSSPVISMCVSKRFVASLDEEGHLIVWKHEDSLQYYSSIDIGVAPGRGRAVSMKLFRSHNKESLVILLEGGNILVVWIMVSEPIIAPMLRDVRVEGRGILQCMSMTSSSRECEILSLVYRLHDDGVVVEEYCMQAVSEDARFLQIELSHTLPITADVVEGDEIVCIRNMSKSLIAVTRAGRILYRNGNAFKAMQNLGAVGGSPCVRMEYDEHNRMISLLDESKLSLAVMRIEHADEEEDYFVSACGEIRSSSGSIESFVWMHEEITPCIAVAYSTGYISIYSLSNASFDTWKQVGEFQGSLNGHPVSLQYVKSCLVAQWDTSIGIINNTLLEGDTISVQLGRVLVKNAGPIPQYHPRFLQCLIYSGLYKECFKILDAFASWMESLRPGDCCSEDFVLSPKISSASGESSLNNSNEYDIISKAFSSVTINELVSQNVVRLPEMLRSLLKKSKTKQNDSSTETLSHPGKVPTLPCNDTGMLDMSAFGMPPTAPAAQEPASVQDTGMLDMSAFGMPPTAPAAQEPASVQDTGMLDMSAFGMPPAAPLQVGRPETKTKMDEGKFKMQTSQTVSVSTCQTFLSVVNRILMVLKKGSREMNESSFANESESCDPVPGLSLSETKSLIAALKKTGEILGLVDKDIESTTLIYLLCLAWSTSQTIEFARNNVDIPARERQVERVLRPKKSIRNAAGIEWDLNARHDDSTEQLNSIQSVLKSKLGFGDNVSVQSVIWLCLSSLAADSFSTLTRFIATSDQKPQRVSEMQDFKVRSTSQDVTSWDDLRSSGVAFWLRDKRELANLVEETSKNLFRESRDADTVALLYAAIGKTSIISGLYRTCNRAKEADFFSRDFSQTRNQQAACKNAFVLLGQHRYSLAATFFILGGKLSDAIEICVRDLEDTQLAIILYKLLGNKQSIDMRKMLDEIFQQYTELSSINFLKAWVLEDIDSVIDCCITASAGSESFWLLPALSLLLEQMTASELTGMETQKVLHSLQKTCMNTSGTLYRNGMPSLGLQFDMIASNCFPLKPFKRWKRDASYACAHALMEMPMECIPTVYTEKFFSQRIQDYIDVLESLQTAGIKISSNVVLHTIGDVYKRLAQRQSLVFTDTSKSLDSIHLGRSNSIDEQSCHSGISSMKRGSLDDSRELARMLARSQKTLAADDSPDQIVYPKGVEIFCVNGDTTYSICSCPLLAPDVCGRLVAVSTSRNGILEFATHPDVEVPGELFPDRHHTEAQAAFDRHTPKGDAGKHGGMFTRFVSQIFDQATWMTDPLEDSSHIIDGDVGLAVASAISSASSKKMDSDPAKPPPLAGAKTTYSKMLVSHPHRQLFLSGCKDTGRIKLWQFDGPRPLGIFTPVPYKDLQDLKSNPDMFSFSSKFARSSSLTSRMGHWGKAVDIAFSENGERFASIGEGGVVAVWRTSSSMDRYSDIDGAHCSEWWQTCLDQQGRAVAFVGGSSVVVAAAGSSSSGNISLWNITSSESCVGRLHHHKSPINRLKTLPGGWLLAAGDDAGHLSITDVRMLGSSNTASVLWTTKACKGTLRAISTISLDIPGESRAQPIVQTGIANCGIVSGGDDGVIRIWEASSGKLIQQTISPHASTTPKTNRILALASGDSHTCGITDLTVSDEGIMSTGRDGIVRLFPRL